MIKFYKSSVEHYEIDNMGHMNVQFYVQHALNACELLFKIEKLIGWPQSLQSQFHLKNIFVRYLREQTLGTPFGISGTILNISRQKITVLLEMKNLLLGHISAAFLMTFKCQDKIMKAHKSQTAVKKSLFLPDGIIPKHGLRKGLLKLPSLNFKYHDIRNTDEIFDSFIGLAEKKSYSKSTQLSATDYMGIISKAVPHLLLQGEHSVEETGIGGAALEYDFQFSRFVETGEGIKLKSGLRKINEKTYIWTHWLISLENNEILAIADSVIITMNLKTRKSVVIPAKMRAKLEALLLP